MWVQANFKETQLSSVRIGQPVKIRSDFYKGAVTYEGKVAGILSGTGDVFQLLPPQNASGNWIKIVQRVPVRIALDPDQLRKHPLRLGLSAEATIDVHSLSGPVLANLPREKPLYQTNVYATQGREADKLIDQIIRENGGDLRPEIALPRLSAKPPDHGQSSE